MAETEQCTRLLGGREHTSTPMFSPVSVLFFIPSLSSISTVRPAFSVFAFILSFITSLSLNHTTAGRTAFINFLYSNTAFQDTHQKQSCILSQHSFLHV